MESGNWGLRLQNIYIFIHVCYNPISKIMILFFEVQCNLTKRTPVK